MLTGYPTLETARQAMKLGAQEYCVKPIEKTNWNRKWLRCSEPEMSISCREPPCFF